MSGWGKITPDAAMDSRLTGRDLRVFIFVSAAANGATGLARLRQEEIAKKIGSDRVGVLRSLQKLAELGYLVATQPKGMRRSLEYRVLTATGPGGQMNLFAADEAPRKGKSKPRRSGSQATSKRGQQATSDVASKATTDVASEATPIEQTSLNRRPVGLAAPCASASDLPSSEPVPIRTEAAGTVLPLDATGAVPSVPADEADAVPFLPAGPDRFDRSGFDALEHRLRDAAGPSLDAASPSLRDLSSVFRWLAAGCDLDRDILPAITGRAARHRGRPIRTWGYFEEPVLEAHHHRLALEARMAAPPSNVVPFDPTGVRHDPASHGSTARRPGRFAAAAELRRRQFAGSDPGGSDA